MKALRLITSAAAAAAIVFTSTACGKSKNVVKSQNEAVEITLSWWGNDTRNEYTIEGVKKFQKLHPEINVDCNYSEWSGYESRSRVQMISDTEADVMQINYGWLKQYSPDGTGYYDIESLSDYIDLTNFEDKMLEYGRVNGKLNAIPIAMNVETVYVNKTVYDKYGLALPKTWDDLFAAAEKMSPDGVYPMTAGSKAMWLYAVSYAEQLSGKRILNEDGSLNFTADDFAAMIEFYKKLVDEKVAPQVEYYERKNIDDGTYAGTVAWVSDAKNYCGTAVENGSEMVVSDYTTDGSCAAGVGWYSKPATMYAISKNSEHPREAAILLDFLLNSPEMAELQGIEKGIPLSASARAYLESEGKLAGLQFDASQKMEVNNCLTPIDPIIENGSLIDAFTDASNKVMFDRASLDEASAQLVEDVNAVLNKQ